jgi:uncharacterized membrane protein
MPPTDPVPAPRERLVFLDAFRGLALIFMVLNHTSRWWQDGSLRWSRYYFIYVTMAVAAPIFIFLVGFCLPLSLTHSRGGAANALLPTIWKYAKRGARIIAAGLLLNVLVFPEDPFWGNGVLQTIGLSVIVAGPAALLLRSIGGRVALLAMAALMFLAFGWWYEPLSAWVGIHPQASRVLFLEFPPWPWLALVLFGLVPGQMFVEQPNRASRSRFMAKMTGVGILCIGWIFAYDWWANTPNRWTFKRDFILNHHWTPRGATVVWVIGMVFCLMALFYYLGEVRRMRLTWLVTLGQTALFLYFIHHFIVLTLVNQHPHILFNDHLYLGHVRVPFNNWWHYGAANLLLMLFLLGLGRAWIEIKRVSRARLPFLAALGRA